MEPKRWMITVMIGIVFVLAIPLCFCGCTSSELKGRVLDENGAPIAGAYVVYGYVGVESKIVDSDEYRCPGTITQTDINGNFFISPSLYIRNPLFRSKLSPEIYAIYDPQTHCVGMLPSKIWLERYKPYKQDGLKEFKKLYWWFEARRTGSIYTLVFKNVTDDPAKWYSSIKQLREAFKYCNVIGYWSGWQAPFEQRKQLYDCLIHEYESLKSKYGDMPCGSMAPEDSGIKTFNELISYDFRLYLNDYEKKIFEQKN